MLLGFLVFEWFCFIAVVRWLVGFLFVCLFVGFETGSLYYVALVALELTVYIRLALNSQIMHQLCLPNAEGRNHYTGLFMLLIFE